MQPKYLELSGPAITLATYNRKEDAEHELESLLAACAMHEYRMSYNYKGPTENSSRQNYVHSIK